MYIYINMYMYIYIYMNTIEYIYIYIFVCALAKSHVLEYVVNMFGSKTNLVEGQTHENKDLAEYLHRCAFFMAPSPGTTSSTHTRCVAW